MRARVEEGRAPLWSGREMFKWGWLLHQRRGLLTRVDFYAACARYRVSMFNYLPEELERELASEFGRPLPSK